MHDTIAHYRITGKLGAGGMGEVYRASDTKLSREVALKVIPENFAQDAVRMTRFRREAEVLASLNHPQFGERFRFGLNAPPYGRRRPPLQSLRKPNRTLHKTEQMVWFCSATYNNPNQLIHLTGMDL